MTALRKPEADPIVAALLHRSLISLVSGQVLGLSPRACLLWELLYCLFTLAPKNTILLIKMAFVLKASEEGTHRVMPQTQMIPPPNSALLRNE